MTSDAPKPQRAFVHPQPGEGWKEVAARIDGVDVATLQSWNLHLAMRPPPIVLTPVDILFIEPPSPAPRSSPG